MNKFFLLTTLALVSTAAHATTEDRWNARFSPVPLIIGGVDATIDYRINDHVVLGVRGSAVDFKIKDVSLKGSGAGVHGDYYFEPAFTNGWYLGGQAMTSSFEASTKDSNDQTRKASASPTTIGVEGGYHWFWESFNMNVGAVLGSSSVSEIEVKDDNGNVVDSISTRGASGGIEFMLGWTF